MQPQGCARPGLAHAPAAADLADQRQGGEQDEGERSRGAIRAPTLIPPSGGALW